MKLQWLVIQALSSLHGFKGLNTGCCDNFFGKRIPRLYNSYSKTEFPDVQSWLLCMQFQWMASCLFII